MSNGILELPGEANPLTENILIHVLKGASSSNQQQIQTSTKQLQTWETQEHYYVYLQSAFIDRRLPLEVRWIAITQLKNGIDKYWRKTANNAVSKQDREVIRSRLLESGLNEGDARLAKANALTTAKIVRYDYPSAWPDVITQLIHGLRASAGSDTNPLHLQNVLTITTRVVKELATARLRPIKAGLQAAAPELLRVLGQIFAHKLEQAISGLKSGDVDPAYTVRSLAECILSIKVCRRLLVAGYESPHRESEVQELVSLVDRHFSELLGLCYRSYRSGGEAELLTTHLKKLLVQFGKLYVDLSQNHPVSFVLLDGQTRLQQCWQLVTQFGSVFRSQQPESAQVGTGGDQAEVLILEDVALKALLTFRACLKLLTSPSRGGLHFKKEPQKDEEYTRAKSILADQVFTSSFAIEIVQLLTSQYFILTARDLCEWEEEPDEWEKREEAEGEDFETSIRSCAEKLFLDVAINYKDAVLPPLIEAFRTAASPDNNDIQLKDSVYTAVGLAAAVLEQHLDFDSFVTSCVVSDVQRTQPGCKILRRRVAILLGQWISIKVGEASRPTIYEVFRYLLDKSQPENDEIVRVTAGRHFRNVADDWNFRPESFLPYAPDILTRLMGLIEEVELPETKLTLLNTISVIVERLENHITPYADRILSLLPPLWEQSGEENLMKQAILAIMTRLFTSMQAEGSKYHHLALPIIAGAVEPGSDSQLYLLDDALDLWHAVIQQSPSESSAQIHPDLASMTRFIIPTLELDGDALRKILEITESCILLMPSVMLDEQFLSALLTKLAALLGEVKTDVSGHITNVVEYLMRAADLTNGVAGLLSLEKVLWQSGFFGGLVSGLKESWEAHQITGPKSYNCKVVGIVETDYFALLARITYAAPESLIDLLRVTESATAPPALPRREELEDTVARITWLLDEWFGHAEDVSEPGRRKLMCLALSKLLTLHQPFILTRLQSLMNMWTDVITELTEGQEDKSIDCLVFGTANTAVSENEGITGPEDERRRILDAADPVHAVNLVALVKEILVNCIQRCGGEQQFRDEWLVNVDKDVVAAFGALGIL